ncbi:MAG: ATP-binding protein, partial [Pseudomonadota bacterium]
LEVGGEKRDFLVRVSARSSSDHSLGYVMTIDDLTALVSAQREAAWGDVARRIAHEIKNPLTPIQLSAERLRRKFAPMVEKDRESFEQYADVIVRQTGDIRRMVDEFSKFARMPKPEKKTEDLSALTRDAVLLQRTAREDIAYELTGADDPLPLECDDGMITQALTNLLKNAAEAIEARIEAGDERPGRIAVSLTRSSRAVSLAIEDNGVGLPAGKRSELTEPYVTTREKGTGLGLAIVKKIAEQHGGSLTLASAEAETSDAPPGARVAMDLPLRKSAGDEPTDDRV